MTHGSLFSGIGGFDLAAEWAGWDNIFHCEWNPFGQKVLKHHFPKSISYEDITKTDFSIHRGKVDIISGGFPCQPYSVAGLRKGTADERHLFPEMLRVIKEVKPSWVVGENVRGLVGWNGGLVFDEVCADLESQGYEVQPILIPAASVNAPHKRDRIWFVAHSDHKRKCSQSEYISKENGEVSQWNNDAESSNTDSLNASDTNNEGLQRSKNNGSIGKIWQNRDKQSSRCISSSWENFPTKSPLCGGDDGIPRTLDSISFPKWRNESIKAYGNAIVPQVAYQLFKTINAYENQIHH
jgi:DNA (cytosine-5)-methyltransferase 1